MSLPLREISVPEIKIQIGSLHILKTPVAEAGELAGKLPGAESLAIGRFSYAVLIKAYKVCHPYMVIFGDLRNLHVPQKHALIRVYPGNIALFLNSCAESVYYLCLLISIKMGASESSRRAGILIIRYHGKRYHPFVRGYKLHRVFCFFLSFLSGYRLGEVINTDCKSCPVSIFYILSVTGVGI